MEANVELKTEGQTDRNVQEILRHIVSLDGVRGVAILLVLCYHVLWSNSGSPNPAVNLLLQLRGSGWVGVDLFFALSGFLITGILFESIQDRRFFKNFYGRRVLRIFPLYYGVVLVLVLVFLIAGTAQDLKLVGIVALYLQNTPLFLKQPYNPTVLSYTGHLWSLAVEEQFYLVWPIIVFLVRDRRKLMWVAAVLAALAPVVRGVLLAHGTPYGEVYRYTICRADSLLVGAWLALAVRGPARERVLKAAKWSFWVALTLCCGIAAATGNFDWEKNYAVNVVGFSAVAMVSVSVIAMALQAGTVVESIMRTGWLRFLGKYSYGIYVYHQIVLASPLMAFAQRALSIDQVGSRLLSRTAVAVLATGLTILISVVSFNYFEKPFLKLKRFFNYDRR